MNILNSLYLYKYRITIQPEETIILPAYKGSALRGVFGYTLRKIVCVYKNKPCQECILKHKCVYSYIIETPPNPDDPYSKKYSLAPHPYVLTPPITKKQRFNKDDILQFELVLIGKANEYLPYIIYTFQEMGEKGIGKGRGKFKLINVESETLSETYNEIYNSTTGILKSVNAKIDYEALSSQYLPSTSYLTLDFKTPLRLKEKNRLITKQLPFALLIERLYERAMLLAYYHCNAKLEEINNTFNGADKVMIKANKLRWYDWERHSTLKGKMKFGGLIGSITYEGKFDKFLPLLKLGEFIHIGKNTTFGLGKYKINKV